jgi:VWFA-related protein
MRHAALLLLLLTISTAVGAAQAKDDVLRINTRLVQVDVVVRDKSGLVADLKKEDFAVFDNGKPQRIDVFSVSTSKPSNAQQTMAPLSPGVVSNRREPGSEIPASVTVILFDMLNTALTYQNQAVQQLIAYLRTVKKEDRIALYILENELHVVQDFTSDPDALIRAAAGIKLGEVAGGDLRAFRELSRAVGSRRVAGSMMGFYRNQRVDPTADAIESIIRHLGGVPGRKNLVWLSANIPLSVMLASRASDKESQIDRAGRLLNEANVAIYPVDIRGLLAPDLPANTGRRGIRLESYPPPEAMVRLADATGGRAAYFNNDIQGAVRGAVSDAEVSYTVGFYPSESGFDGQFHKLAVKVDKKGVEIRHRAGYYSPSDRVPTAQERQSLIAELLDSPLDALQIALAVRAEPDQTQAGNYRVTISIDAKDLHLEHQDDRWTGTLDLGTYVESANPKSFKLQTIPLNLSDELFQTALRRGLLIEQIIPSSRPDDRFRIVLHDRATGLAGSLWVPLKAR